MGFDEDTALSTCELITTDMEYLTETLAEVSARLGIGDVNSETVKDWYYQKSYNLMFKKLFCRHDYKPWANVHGDMINKMNCRTVLLCTKCGKRKFIKDYIPAPLNYGAIFDYYHYMDLYGADTAMDMVYDSLVKDEELFLKLFGGNIKDEI